MIVGQLAVIIVPAAVAALGHPVCAGRAGARHAGRLAQLPDWHGIRHAVLVRPNSAYGEDNRCLAHLAALDMIAGVQVVDDQLVALEHCSSAPGCACTLTIVDAPIRGRGSIQPASGSCCGGASPAARW
jgi:hypothetical protein